MINDAGTTAFSASFTGSGTNSGGIWSSGPGGSALVARTGGQAAGTPAGVVYYGVNLYEIFSAGRTFLFNDAGQVAFQDLLFGSGVDSSNREGIWDQRHGNLELVARTGSHAPGTPDGVNFRTFTTAPALNDAGQIAFAGELTGSGVNSTNNLGIWSEGFGGLALVARKGSQAPGMPDGTVFNPPFRFASPALNNAGQTAFAGNVTGGGVDSTNNQGIWSEASGSLALVARSGSPAPGTPSGVNFSSFLTPPALNDAGQLAIYALLAGDGVNSTNSGGLWSGAPGSLALVARKGDHAPGTEDGVVFASLNTALNVSAYPKLNAAGQTAFHALLAGSGISASNDLGIWATDRSGALQLIAHEGDPLEVAAGDFRTISSLTFHDDFYNYSTGNSDGRPSAFNNRGQLAFSATFTDGTSGIFVSNRVPVPEPSAIALVATGLLGLVGCDPRRQRHRSDQQNRRTTTARRERRSDGDACGTLMTTNSR